MNASSNFNGPLVPLNVNVATADLGSIDVLTAPNMKCNRFFRPGEKSDLEPPPT